MSDNDEIIREIYDKIMSSSVSTRFIHSNIRRFNKFKVIFDHVWIPIQACPINNTLLYQIKTCDSNFLNTVWNCFYNNCDDDLPFEWAHTLHVIQDYFDHQKMPMAGPVGENERCDLLVFWPYSFGLLGQIKVSTKLLPLKTGLYLNCPIILPDQGEPFLSHLRIYDADEKAICIGGTVKKF